MLSQETIHPSMSKESDNKIALITSCIYFTNIFWKYRLCVFKNLDIPLYPPIPVGRNSISTLHSILSTILHSISEIWKDIKQLYPQLLF